MYIHLKPGIPVSIMIACLSIALILTACSSSPAGVTDQSLSSTPFVSMSKQIAVETPQGNSAENVGQQQLTTMEDSFSVDPGVATPASKLVATTEIPVAGDPIGTFPTGISPTEVAVIPQPALEIKPEVGFQAPNFTLETLHGQSFNLADLRGHPLLINYWATWCEPCKQELPILQKLQQEYAGTGLQVLTIAAIEQDNLGSIQALAQQMGLSLPVLLDYNNQFQSLYKQLFFPTSYFIDANGVVRSIKLGDAKEAELRTKIEQLVNDQF